ncbi:dynein light chain Tctex-type 5-like [Chironomus tepperi]|uniref:dynein light chain Tctex-type 5-like n=1 Tax=Chironomus tepperi TaxID=113505 RepID=UPI00391F0245
MTQRVLRFQNSYRLEARNPFNRDEVERILGNVMENHFSSIEKFDGTSVAMCRNVSDDAMALIKAKNFDRYKIIVVVTACEKFMQGICYSNKNLWDAPRDALASYVYDHPSFFAIGTCYGIYFE